MDLYNRLSGIALFLAYLGRITQEDRYTRLAHAAATTLRRQIEQDEQTRSVGGFSGWGGVVYALTHLAVLWDQPELLTEAERIAERLPELIEQDEVLDVIAGSAGCIGGLLSLYRFLPSEQTLAVAVQCADRLIERAQPMSQGVGWMPHARVGTRPLAGFSHGAAGMAWALLELHAITDEERYRTTAVEAIAYERSLFLPEAGNWPDLREFEGRDQPTTNGRELPQFMTAWCHGAPGIGIARLRALQHLDDPEIRTEIDVALQTTLAQGFGRNHSLCHGDLGNLELLLQASLTLDAPRWGGHVNRLTAMILESIEEHGWLCGVPLGVETPGLMTGLAGIGYGLLRLAAPERVPSVLLMEPPKLPQTATTPASIQAPSVVPGGIA